MRTLVRAKYIISHDGADHRILENGVLLHDGDRIVFVGREPAGAPIDADEVIDAGNAVVSPGFIDLNALGDIDHALFDTWQDDELRRGLTWSREYLLHHGPVFTPEEARFRRQYAAAALARNGITTMMAISAETYLDWCEDYTDMAYLADAVEHLGTRAYLGPSYRDAVPYTDGRRTLLHWDEGRGRAGLADATRFLRDFDGAAGGRTRGMLAPARIETMSEDRLRDSRALADRFGCPIRLHAAQGLWELEQIRARTGKRSIPYLRDIGFLGEGTVIPHAWAVPGHSLLPDTQGDDVGILAEHRVTVVFCPLPSARLVGVMESYDSYRSRGVRVCLGTDSAPPSMLKAMELGNVLMKRVDGDRTAASFADLFRSATTEPAAVLGRADLGRLSVGAQADYFILDLGRDHTGPTFDPIRTMVMNSDSRDITEVRVAGRPVVRRGQIVTVDTSGYGARAQALLDRYAAAFSEQDYRHRSTSELLPPSFPPAPHDGAE